MGTASWPAELHELYEQDRLRLVRTAYLICGSRAAAEDAVHDAVLRVAARWSDVIDGRRYLTTAVVNAARDIARRNTRFSLADPADAAGSVDVASVTDDALALRDALAELPERHRVVLVLRYFADWDDAEIAEALDIRPATVRSWAHRGITKLRRELGE